MIVPISHLNKKLHEQTVKHMTKTPINTKKQIMLTNCYSELLQRSNQLNVTLSFKQTDLFCLTLTFPSQGASSPNGGQEGVLLNSNSPGQ